MSLRVFSPTTMISPEGPALTHAKEIWLVVDCQASLLFTVPLWLEADSLISQNAFIENF